MTTAEIVVVAVVAVVALIALAVAVAVAIRRRKQLREHFGPEYDRTLAATGDRKETDAQLRERVNRRERVQLRPLSRLDRDAFEQEWRQIQARFVDAPHESLADAERLLTRVMRERGYPVDDFDQQADLISVDHPRVVGDYRKGRDIREADRLGRAGTDEQREAVLAYRSLFAELLDHSTGPDTDPRDDSGKAAIT